jgi:hypothetical protein
VRRALNNAKSNGAAFDKVRDECGNWRKPPRTSRFLPMKSFSLPFSDSFLVQKYFSFGLDMGGQVNFNPPFLLSSATKQREKQRV